MTHTNKILGQLCPVEYFCNHNNAVSTTEKHNFEFYLKIHYTCSWHGEYYYFSNPIFKKPLD